MIRLRRGGEIVRAQFLAEMTGTLDELAADTWACPYCGESNYADGRKQCHSCRLAAPPDPADDPSYCCERCEHLTGLDDALASWFEQQMEAIHR